KKKKNLPVLNNNFIVSVCILSDEFRDFGPNVETESTVKIVYIGTDGPLQTLQTQITLLSKEQSDQGLHCLPFHLHLLL
ncbi:MAG: hypothetical protein AB2693_26925, partial [Candidatus Thiodiazotropha sp.]